jgi:hypothetical protein
MTTTIDTYNEECPENTGVEQVWSGDVFIGYQVFMDEEEYKRYLRLTYLQELARERSDLRVELESGVE